MLAKRINKRLQELKWTQADLCRATGFASSYVSYLCNGERGRRPTLETMQKLSKALGVTLDFFSEENSHMCEKTVQGVSA